MNTKVFSGGARFCSVKSACISRDLKTEMIQVFNAASDAANAMSDLSLCKNQLFKLSAHHMLAALAASHFLADTGFDEFCCQLTSEGFL